ncbi:MAG TPA: tRNA pseudouridine(55) synthase TruB [Dehalococcoidia bacterium]|nr:tRNA pseudouridine(55) synthase TruB [Dehalococcoidia bacterium]
MISGILNVDKPAGWTSFDVVRFVRGRCGERRLGHAGTLDPAATGVLPLLLGQATRLTEYLVDTTKTYEATITLGVETDTYDAEGDVVARADAAGVTRDDIEVALAAFRGEIMQMPPLYSAIKRDGEALYKKARRGEDVVLEPRPVRVDELGIMRYDPPLIGLRIVCSKGFYVRSLAHDIGAALGVGGSLSALRRTRVGSFQVEGAVDIDTLRDELTSGAWRDRLYAPDEVLLGRRAAILGDDNETRLRHGVAPVLGAGTLAAKPEELCRAYSASGDFLAVLRATGAREWRPDKVFVT